MLQLLYKQASLYLDSGHNTTLSYTEVQLSMLKKKSLTEILRLFYTSHTVKHNTARAQKLISENARKLD